MINRHNFQEAAGHFRAGRISLKDLADQVYGSDALPKKTPASNDLASTSPDSVKIVMPQRPDDAHKGNFGKVLIVGGSVGMAGAITLTSISTLKSGAGVVKVITPEPVRSLVAGFSPCTMVTGLPSSNGMFSSEAFDLFKQSCGWADVVAFGPGMGVSRTGQEMAQYVYSEIKQPVVIDADGINNLAASKADLATHAGPRILTPHPGEFCRLVESKSSTREKMESQAIALAAENRMAIVLKGHRSLVTDGDLIYRNQTGNSGMATAGSGDVLTGIIAALLAQGLSPIDAAKTGCYVHGAAGDEAAKRVGPISMIATDLLNSLSGAFKKLAAQP